MKLLFFLLILPTLSFANEKAALNKIKLLGKNLQKELKKGMKESPMKALEVCNIKAPQVLASLPEDHIQVGRVSTKNRNPNNRPQEWMKSYIEKFHKKEIKKPFIVVEIKDGQKGLLKPIKTMPLCLKCHGDNIDSELSKKIKELYPNDKAIGYKNNQIRGFFYAIY